jgi:DDE superfamily endonuclease
MTLAEIADHLLKVHGEGFVPRVVWRFFDRRNHVQKNIARQRAGPTGYRRRRAAWKASRPEIGIHRLVFIDETGASTKMARRYGRSPYGQSCIAALPHGHWKTTTFVGALGATDMTAPMVLDGPMDGPAFEAYVTQVLVPTLRPGDIVVMDNLTAHKRAESASQSTRREPSSSICRPQSRASKGRRQINQGFGQRYRPRTGPPSPPELLRRHRL